MIIKILYSYKNKLAGSDMRLKNRPDPHAFV